MQDWTQKTTHQSKNIFSCFSFIHWLVHTNKFLSYSLFEFYGYCFASGTKVAENPKITVIDGNGSREISNGKFSPCVANAFDVVTIKYEIGDSVLSYEIPCAKGVNDRDFIKENYFYSLNIMLHKSCCKSNILTGNPGDNNVQTNRGKTVFISFSPTLLYDCWHCDSRLYPAIGIKKDELIEAKTLQTIRAANHVISRVTQRKARRASLGGPSLI